MNAPRLARTLAVLLLATLASCSSMPWGSRFSVSKPAEVPEAVAAARTDLEQGRTADALERMRSAREVEGLSVDLRDEVEGLMETCAATRIDELSQPGADPDELADLAQSDLPQQLSVSAGLLAARRYLADDESYDAYKVLKDLETAFPRHHGRAEASEVLVEAGLRLIRSGKGWWLWLERDEGIEVLEFVVLSYPSERRCDEAFFELGRAYEYDHEYALAIQRHEELIVSHLDSPYSVQSQARIPRLRLMMLESPEYDRKDLLRARTEIESWLAAHSGHALENEVRLDYADCLARLVRSDLGVARFNAGSAEDALAAWDRATDLDPEEPVAWSNRAAALRALGRPADALVAYDQVVALKPDNATNWQWRGDVLA
ncbi:MAG: tetratricopeptide repeat protein, partial [Planctomycetota bacterium]|nr:tetratricopeptide repeat protein [Planctomycetota bacterium]